MSATSKQIFKITFALVAFLWAWGAISYYLADLDITETRPWTIPQLLAHERTSPQVLKRLLTIGGSLAVAILGIWILAKTGKREKAYGDARFSRGSELQSMGLRDKKGLVLGKLGQGFLINDGQTHVLVTAPTGSGKGVGIVIPNLLSWPGSAVVLDVKGENFDITAGFREESGQLVFNFSPLSGSSHRYNPFDLIAAAPRDRRITMIQNMATTLLPDPDRGDKVWAQRGRGLFVGLALYLMDAPDREATLGNVLRHLQTEEKTTDVCKVIIADYRDDLDPVAVRNLAAFSQLDTGKGGSIAESVKLGLAGALALWDNPLVDAATSETDFDITSLRETPTTIYIGVRLPDLQTLQPLLRLFVEQVFAAQLNAEPGPHEPHKVLMLLDEFEALGTMNSVVDNLPFVRSFNVRMMNIIQGLTQLDLRYGQAGREKILQASAHQIFFALNDKTTTEYVSYRLGRKTIRQQSRNVGSGGVSRNRSEMGRDLMMPQEVATLSADEEVILVEGEHPVKARKIRYYADRAMKRRAGRPTPTIPDLRAVRHESPTFATETVDDDMQEEIAHIASELQHLL